MKRIHYAWLICASCTLLLFTAMGMAVGSFTVYQPYLISVKGLSNTEASSVVMVRNLFSLLAMLSVGAYYRRVSLRRGAALALMCTALAFLLYSVANSFFTFCAAAAMAGLGYGYGGMVPASLLIGRWFSRHQGLALGICSAGSGMATVVVPPIITPVIERVSLQAAFRLECVFALCIAVTAYCIIRDDPADMQLCPLGEDSAPTAAAAPTVPMGARRPLQRGESFALLFAIVLLGMVSNPGFTHLSVLFRENGFPSSTISLLLSFAGITLVIGKCIYGQIVDRFGARRSGYLFFWMMTLGMALCCVPGGGHIAVALISLTALGIGLPLCTVGMSIFARDLSVHAQYGSLLRRIQCAYMTGALMFSSVPGILADLTGSYKPSYWILTAASFLCMVIIQGIYRRQAARDARDQACSS